MPGHGLQARGIAREQKMIYAGMTLFLEQGYGRTTTAQIARKAGMSPASFFAAFENKEALLLRLTQIMFRSQFSREDAPGGSVAAAAVRHGDGAAAPYRGVL